METDKIKKLYEKYGLSGNDVFQHKHYQIITRSGIDKIQAKEKIYISYEAIKVESDFCVVKASAEKDDAKIQTFGSAKYGGKKQDPQSKKWVEVGNTTTWYVMEMAEKRAMSRAVLKLTGFYELGVFGEDESEDFKKNAETPLNKDKVKLDITVEVAKTHASNKVPLADVMLTFNMNADQQSKYIKLLDNG